MTVGAYRYQHDFSIRKNELESLIEEMVNFEGHLTAVEVYNIIQAKIKTYSIVIKKK